MTQPHDKLLEDHRKLVQELAVLHKDAERYRALRSDSTIRFRLFNATTEEEFDERVDAAMERAKK